MGDRRGRAETVRDAYVHLRVFFAFPTVHEEAEVLPHEEKSELGKALGVVLHHTPGTHTCVSVTSFRQQDIRNGQKRGVTSALRTTHVPKWLRKAAMYSRLLWYPWMTYCTCPTGKRLRFIYVDDVSFKYVSGGCDLSLSRTSNSLLLCF